jgi:hypothetical protein
MKSAKKKVKKLQLSKESLQSLTAPSALGRIRGGESVARPCTFGCATGTCGEGWGCDTGNCGQEL